MLSNECGEQFQNVFGVLKILAVEVGFHHLQNNRFDGTGTGNLLDGNCRAGRNFLDRDRSIAQQRSRDSMRLGGDSLHIAIEDARGLAVEPPEPFEIDDTVIGNDPCIQIVIEKIPDEPDERECAPETDDDYSGM